MKSKAILHGTLWYLLACFAGLLLHQDAMAQNGQGNILDNPPTKRERIKPEHQITRKPASSDRPIATPEMVTPVRHLWGDVDNDGFMDLFVLDRAGNLLFRNLGNGGFEDITVLAFPGGAGNGDSGIWGDYNGDDLPDLFLFHSEGFTLYHNEGKLHFSDVTRTLGLPPDLSSHQVILKDYDGDGFEDLLVQTPERDRIFRNRESREFVETVIENRGTQRVGKRGSEPPVQSPGGQTMPGASCNGSPTSDAMGDFTYVNDNSPNSVGFGVPEVEGGDDTSTQNDIVDGTVTGKDLDIPLTMIGDTYASLLACSNSLGDAITVKTFDKNSVGVRAFSAAKEGASCGVRAEVESVDGKAVYGKANSNTGENFGLFGETASETGTGVYGYATHADGYSCGVYGICDSSNGIGVHAEVTAKESLGVNFGVYAQTYSPISYGVYGHAASLTGIACGVAGWSESKEGCGVQGHASATSGKTIGVRGSTMSPDGFGGYFEGGLSTDTLNIRGGSDLSEKFDIRGEGFEPGMVVCIDPLNPGALMVSGKRYDRKVAGIISGAGGVKTGMLMGQEGSMANGDNPVALTGRVYCLTDAANGSIEPGDLLTTSNTPGHAMKVTNFSKANGAVIGKAMTSLESGKGLVLVLVALQ